LDGCFLEDPFKSEFLPTVGRDTNNQIFPIAWVVVKVDYTDSWAWFLNFLSTDLELEHRNCVRHVFANRLGRKLGKSYGFDSWQIVKCTTERETKMMTRIVENRKLRNGWKKNYGPLVKAKFDANKKDCVEWQLIWNGENRCELRKENYQYTVDLSQRICSCRS
ncbi:hypothetical protein Golax_002443, partial [Gossypium laxum]|nr:hypothetical protein [Gossypium laxum]